MAYSTEPSDFFAKIRRKSEGLIRQTVANGEPDLNSPVPSAWLNVARAIVETSISGDPSKLTDVGLDLLGAIIGVEDEQGRLLRSIDHQVTLLRDGPFRSGRIRLEEAARVSHDRTRAHEFLQEARARFYDAHGLSGSLHERGIVEVHLGVVWWLLNQPEDSRHWFTVAHATLTELLDDLVRAAGNVQVVRTKSAVAFASYLYPVAIGMLAAKIRKVRRSERALQALAQLLPVLTTVARSAAATGQPGLASYRLLRNGNDWALEPVAAQEDP